MALLLLVAACSHSSPSSPSSPSPKPAAEDCVADSSLEGKPCPVEGKVCGARAAAAATGFSNVITCSGGVWTRTEVPPPPPPH